MTQAAAFRGQPLLVLTVLLGGWIAVRAAVWQSPIEMAHTAKPLAEPVREAFFSARAVSVSLERREPRRAVGWVGVAFHQSAGSNAKGLAEAEPDYDPPVLAAVFQLDAPPPPGGRQSRVARSRPFRPTAAPLFAVTSPPPDASVRRWSADAWLFWRRDGASSILTDRPSYGRSQAGGVIRYTLVPASRWRPRVYLRTSTALAGAREQEAAVGLSARLLPAVPVRLTVEARLSKTSLGTRGRPAVSAVTELPPIELPLGVRAEVYAQGGYVGGDFATAFVDGQARLERPIFRHREPALSAGAGIWGGAQKGARRLDVGPTAAVSFRLGGARGRVSADYRFRVAGDAAPSSGPALTLSAGF